MERDARRAADPEIRKHNTGVDPMRNMPTQRRVDDKGFTLIELMVVVLIIAILLAIAIPTFLGAQNKAKDRSAQSSARNALTNAKTIFADASTYVTVTPALLLASEPSLTFVDASTTSSGGAKDVSVLTSTSANQWFAAVLSETNTCFYIADNLGPAQTVAPLLPAGTSYAKVTGSSTTTCKAVAPSATVIYKAGW
jgi:type IV pilus assembly protein PilA